MPSIDRSTLPFKVFNVAMYGAYGIFYFYSPLLLARRGIPGTIVGAILALRPVVGTIVTPMWTAVADAYHIHRCLHVFFLIVGSVSRLLYLLVPIKPASLLAAAALSECLTCAIVPLADSATFDGLERLGRSREEYAAQRLWGAVGAGWIFVPLCGALLSASPRDAAWTLVLGLHIGFLTLSALVPIWSVGGRNGGHSAAAPAPRCCGDGGATRCDVLTALRSSDLRFSWAATFRCLIFLCCGAFHAVTEGYIFLYLDALGGTELLDGLAITFTCLSEVRHAVEKRGRSRGLRQE